MFMGTQWRSLLANIKTTLKQCIVSNGLDSIASYLVCLFLNISMNEHIDFLMLGHRLRRWPIFKPTHGRFGKQNTLYRDRRLVIYEKVH